MSSIRLSSKHSIVSYLFTSRSELQTNLATYTPRMRNRNLENSIADASGRTQLTATRVLVQSKTKNSTKFLIPADTDN